MGNKAVPADLLRKLIDLQLAGKLEEQEWRER